MKFKTKPCVIEAMQWTGANTVSVVQFCPAVRDLYDTKQFLLIPTLEGEMQASVGDWIVKGLKGEFYPVKPDIFALKYEPAE